MATPYPFSAIVGQEEMKLAILLAAVDPGIGGVLVFGDRGTGKSTAVRALAALLPAMRAVRGCRFGCDPDSPPSGCPDCARLRLAGASAKATAGAANAAASPARTTAPASTATTTRSPRPRAPAARLPEHKIPVPVVDLPLGATEDRVVGALDLQRALADGTKAFEPGLLARAHRGFLYIDEVNLLDDHLVDLLIDVAASGENVVEREGLSLRHPARFVLVGSGNPEEGELRPQLLDRFGLSVEVKTPDDLPTRVEVVKRRDAFDRDPAGFAARWSREDARLRRQVLAARTRLATVQVDDAVLHEAARLCMRLGTDGLRGELTVLRAARALAAFEGEAAVGRAQLLRVAPSALRHRLRRDPLDDTGSGTRVARAIAELAASPEQAEPAPQAGLTAAARRAEPAAA